MTKEEFVNMISAARPDIAIGTRDSGAQLLRVLTLNVAPSDVVKPGGDEVWHGCGQHLMATNRVYEALGLFLKLYEMKLSAQCELKTRAHKGSDLIWIASRPLGSLPMQSDTPCWQCARTQ